MPEHSTAWVSSRIAAILTLLSQFTQLHFLPVLQGSVPLTINLTFPYDLMTSSYDLHGWLGVNYILISSAHLHRQDFIQMKISLHFCYSSFVCQITVGFPVCHLKKESTLKMCTALCCPFLNALWWILCTLLGGCDSDLPCVCVISFGR